MRLYLNFLKGDGCGRRIRTASLAYEASELPLLHLRNGANGWT